MSADAAVPRPDVVQQALRTTTERLAHELACPTDVTPSWSEFEWRAARAAAAIHGVGPLLATTLRWRGPTGWQTFLAEQRDHTESRHRRIEELTQFIDLRARDAGIPLVRLKGAALHAMGLYKAGERPMADLDFLVEELDLTTATRLLESQDFREGLRYWKNAVFNPKVTHAAAGGVGEHRDNHIKVELHWRIREKLPLELTDISEFIFPRNPRPGLNDYPSRASLLMHLVLHAAGAMPSRELRLLNLHDIALVCGSLQAQDWEEILRQDEHLWWCLPPLQLAGRYYPNIVPQPVLARLQRSCPSRLSRATARQSLTDVSFSSLWIHAFPGIEWSRSMAGRIRYMLARVRPDAEAKAIRDSDAASAAWAIDNHWQVLSQKSRIVQWMTSRPTRTPTMYVIREALSQPR